MLIAIVLCLFVVATVLTEIERWGWATATLIASVVAMHYFNVFDVVAYLRTHVMETVIYVGVYFAAGVPWSFVKWFSFLYRFRDEYRETKESFKTAFDKREKMHAASGFGADVARPSLDEAFKHAHPRFAKRPTAAENKSRIVAWMSLWPLSMVGTLLNDPVRRLVNFLFNRFKKLYQRSVDYVFRNDADLV